MYVIEGINRYTGYNLPLIYWILHFQESELQCSPAMLSKKQLYTHLFTCAMQDSNSWLDPPADSTSILEHVYTYIGE